MPSSIDGSPSPRSHIKTLMRIGYDFCTAVSDIVDNSISADSKYIDIYCPPGLTSPFLRIGDDGFGMDEEELLQNMRIGCKDASESRSAKDLGRFGSGMKTASFSQARILTVVSKKLNGDLCGARWDINKIESSDTWCLEVLDSEDIELLEKDGKVDIGEIGTQVIWESLTCYQDESHSFGLDEEMAAHLASLRKHVGLHFHRFMSGKDSCSISINNNPVVPIDPFLSNCEGYQEGRREKFRCKGGHIVIQTHVLPSIGRITPAELEKLGGVSDIAQRQGLYIYRNKRLINAGGWLDLAKHHQLTALARVQIDIPAELDDEWSTDVKKATLQLPPRIKRDLRKYLSDPITKSRKVYTYKGKKDEAGTFWKIVNNEETKKLTYEINSENQDFQNLVTRTPPHLRQTFLAYITRLSVELPIHHIYNSMADRPRDIKQNDIEELILEDILNLIGKFNNEQ